MQRTEYTYSCKHTSADGGMVGGVPTPKPKQTNKQNKLRHTHGKQAARSDIEEVLGSSSVSVSYGPGGRVGGCSGQSRIRTCRKRLDPWKSINSPLSHANG